MLFERDVLRSFDGTSSAIANKAYEQHYAAYFQDRWKPSRQNLGQGRGARGEQQASSRRTARTVLGALLASALPTNTADEEFHQIVACRTSALRSRPADGACFGHGASRSYEWLDLGGGDGTSHAPYVLATDMFRANPRTSATLNQTLPGGFPLGLNFGGTPDDSIHNGRTYVNEFSGSWEHRLPHSSSFSTTFLLAADRGTIRAATI